MKLHTFALRYAFFAVLAATANLATQRIAFWFGDIGMSFALAVMLGTVVGLVVKYFLDKRWIFRDMSTGIRAHGIKFSRYTTVGIFTTAIFWGMETAFWFFWQTDAMREIGAVVGLGIGYFAKYRLDKRYVFTYSRLMEST